MELLERKESVVNRVAMRSSTRNQPDSNSRVRRTRSRKKPESNSSDSDQNEVEPEPTRPVVHLEKGVEENRLPIDISSEVGRAIADSNPKIVPKTVRFDDVPVVIKSNPDIRIDEYDIIRDIKDQKANVTIGQLLHDNTNYQKLIREA
jgi:Fe-S-cluster formation regulator IscX/YfhJ